MNFSCAFYRSVLLYHIDLYSLHSLWGEVRGGFAEFGDIYCLLQSLVCGSTVSRIIRCFKETFSLYVF